MCEVLDCIESRGIQQGIQQGIPQGKQQAEVSFAKLMQALFAAGRIDDAKHAAEDADYRHYLMQCLDIPE